MKRAIWHKQTITFCFDLFCYCRFIIFSNQVLFPPSISHYSLFSKCLIYFILILMSSPSHFFFLLFHTFLPTNNKSMNCDDKRSEFDIFMISKKKSVLCSQRQFGLNQEKYRAFRPSTTLFDYFFIIFFCIR